MQYKNALRNTKTTIEKEVFRLLSTTREKLDFWWYQKPFRNEEQNRIEQKIYCRNRASDYVFSKIKESRGVASMHGTSIDKYLKPINDEIRKLKEAFNLARPQTSPQDLSYNRLQTSNHLPKDEENWGNKKEKLTIPDSSLRESENKTRQEKREELINEKKELLKQRNDILAFAESGIVNLFKARVAEIDKEIERINLGLEQIDNYKKRIDDLYSDDSDEPRYNK